MARSTRTSLAGQAADAARRIVRRRPATPAADEGAGSAPAKKAPAKKASATKAPAKKAPATKAPAKKAPAKKAPATKASATKAPATKAAATKAPARKTTTKKAATEAAPAAKATARRTATTKAAKTPVKKASTVADNTPAKKAAAKQPASTRTTAKAPAKAPGKAPAKKAAAKKAPAATAPTKKAPASALVVKEDEEAWTKEELAEVLTELHEQRDHSARIVAAQEAELSGLMRDSGDGAGHDQADLGATSFERDHELTVLNNERDKLAQIERALLRIDDGSYGRCESCGNAIGKMRLMAFPRATLCLTCKQREERR